MGTVRTQCALMKAINLADACQKTGYQLAITVWRILVGSYQPSVFSPQLPKAEAEGSGDLRALPKSVGTEVAFARTGRCSRHSDVNLRYPHI